MTVLVVQAVNRDTAEQNDRGANQNVDGGAEFTRPVAAVELQEERRNEEEDRCFANVQPAPVGSCVASVTANCFAPGQLLHVPEEEAQSPGDGDDAEEKGQSAQPRSLDHCEGIAFPDAFHEPNDDGTAHNPGDVEVCGHGLSKFFPVRRRDRSEVLPRIVKDAHVVVHRHEVNDEAQAECAEPNGEASCRLLKVLPGTSFKGDDPSRGDPGGDHGEHHAGLSGVFRRIELCQAFELKKLLRIEVRKRGVAEYGLEEAVNHHDHDGDRDEGQHQTFLKRMSFFEPIALEGPEVKNVGHPN